MADRYLTVAGAGTKSGADWANAYSNAEFQTMLTGLAAGDDGHIEEGIYTQSTALICTTVAHSVNDINLIGYDAATHTAGAGRWTIDANSTAVNGLILNDCDYWSIRNFEVINATGDGVKFSVNPFWNGLFDYKVSNCGGKGVNGSGITGFTCSLSAGTIYNNSGNGIDPPTDMSVSNHFIYNNGGHGVRVSTYTPVVNSIIHNNTSAGVSNGRYVFNCIIDGNGTGIIGGANESNNIYENNRITNNTVGISVSGHTLYRNNYFYLNGTKFSSPTLMIDVGDNIDGTADQYADLANDDFTLLPTSEGVGVAIPVGNKDETTNIGYMTQGGIPPEYPTSDAPTFAGITKLEATGRGTLKVTWAAGSGTITGYNVYVRIGNASVFSATYKVFEAPSDATFATLIVDSEADNFLVNTNIYHVGVRACNDGTEDSNTETLSVSPTGDGLTTLQINEDIFRIVKNV